MDSKFKYDIAFSLSDVDKEVGNKLYKAFQSLSHSPRVFYYKENEEDNSFHNLTNQTVDIYTKQCAHALILVSKNYQADTAPWAALEWNLIKSEDNNRNYRYLFIIRIDDSRLKFLSEERIFKPWNDNAYQLAIEIQKIVDKEIKKSNEFYDQKHAFLDPFNKGLSTDQQPRPPITPPSSFKKFFELSLKFWWYAAIGLIVIAVITLIPSKQKDDDIPITPTISLRIEAPNYGNQGVYMNCLREKIADLNSHGIAEITGISQHDTLYLGKGRLRSNPIRITRKHIDDGEIIYNSGY